MTPVRRFLSLLLMVSILIAGGGCAESDAIQWDKWRRRPESDKIGEWVAHLFFRWL